MLTANKILYRDEAAEWAAATKEYGSLLGATCGCFDLLHLGHLEMLEKARRRCGQLIVFVNSDASVRRLKGENRPIIHQEARAGLVAGLQCVDAVALFDADDPCALIAEVKPDLWFKGGDYSQLALPEREAVKQHGGAVVILGYEEGYSTTSLIERIRQDG